MSRGVEKPAVATIDEVVASAYRIPTDNGPEQDGTLQWDATELVVVEVACDGVRSLGYSYTAGAPAKALIETKLAPRIRGADAFDIPALWQRMNDALRNVGRPGLGLMAIAAVDYALWDLKARLLNVPLTRLLGQTQSAVKTYASGGFINTADDKLRAQLRDSAGTGFQAVKIKIGNGVDDDLRRVALAREAVGDAIELMVDANGAYDTQTALALAGALADYRIAWFEEPVSSDNLTGLRYLRERAPPGMAIAAGEYGWDVHYFQRMLAAGAVDVLQIDATRCGFTGFLHAAALCRAYSIPVSAHCAPAVHAPLCTAVAGCRHLEYFHDHVRIENELFTNTDQWRDGAIYPNVRAPGHGLRFNADRAQHYQL